MMFATMHAVGLYPPTYLTRPSLNQDDVAVILLNEERPAVWERVNDWVDLHGFITNRDVCKIADLDTLHTSRLLKRWVENGMLKRDMSKGKRGAFYRKAGADQTFAPFMLLSEPDDNKIPD